MSCRSGGARTLVVSDLYVAKSQKQWISTSPYCDFCQFRFRFSEKTRELYIENLADNISQKTSI